MVKDGAFTHKIDYVTIFLEILNLKGQPNRITGSYCNLSEWVDFAYWCSCIGKDLRLQPAQQACIFIFSLT